jgi:hypothetical protein
MSDAIAQLGQVFLPYKDLNVDCYVQEVVEGHDILKDLKYMR